MTTSVFCIMSLSSRAIIISTFVYEILQMIHCPFLFLETISTNRIFNMISFVLFPFFVFGLLSNQTRVIQSFIAQLISTRSKHVQQGIISHFKKRNAKSRSHLPTAMSRPSLPHQRQHSQNFPLPPESQRTPPD